MAYRSLFFLISLYGIADGRLSRPRIPQFVQGESVWAQQLLQPQYCNRVEFLHIPKTGGTTVELAASNYGVNWGSMRFNNFSCFGDMANPTHYVSAHHVPPAHAIEPIKQVYAKAERVFCISRHPYDRLISEFKYRVGLHWFKFENELPGWLPEWTTCTAESLNRFIEMELFDFPSHQYDLDLHLIPQSTYIWEGEKQWCTDILRLDGFPDNFNTLMEKLNMDVRVKAEHNNEAKCKLTSADLLNTSRSLILSAYRDDFVRLGYSA
jgi:hypothetical protein